MRFCLVSTQADWGGGEKLLWSIRTSLIDQGHQVSWIVRRDEPLYQRVVESEDAVVATLQRRGVNAREWIGVCRGLKWHAPDVLVLNDSHAIMLGGSAALAVGPKRPLRLAFRHVTFPIRSPLKLRMMADSIVCVSEAARRSVLAAGIARQRTVVIYGGGERPEWDPSARAWAERELGMQSTDPLLVCVGNLLECKGHVSLVESMVELRQRIPGVRLVIAGEGSLRERLERRIDQLQLDTTVHLLGFRHDADRWLSAASVVMHPSLQEGLSLVLIQAQRLRKLIVSTGVGGSAEVLGLDDPRPCLAWLARPDDASSLAEQACQAIEAWHGNDMQVAAELERAARRADDKFDISRNVAELVEHARELRQHRRKSLA